MGWTIGGDVTVDRSGGSQSDCAALLTPGSTIGQRINGAAAVGDRLTARCAVRGEAIVTLAILDAGGEELAVSQEQVSVPEWIAVEASIEAPPGARSLEVRVEATTGSARLDDVSIERTQVLTDQALGNPGFENRRGSIKGWTAFNNARLDRSRAAGGTWSLKTFGPFSRPNDASGAHRTFDVEPGAAYEATATCLTPADDSILGTANRSILKIEFLDASGAIVELKEITILDGAECPEDEWVTRSLEATAPANAATARLLFAFFQPKHERGAVWFDDVQCRRTDIGSEPGADYDETYGPHGVGLFNPGFELTPLGAPWLVADGHWSHNNERQYYHPDAVGVEDGCLVIHSLRRPHAGLRYVSGYIELGKETGQVYGRWEMRARLASGQGIWPAMWLLPTDGTWPPEIDVLELIGHEPDVVHHSYHWGPLPEGTKPWSVDQTATASTRSTDFSQAFHEFAVEWTPDAIRWFVDGDLSFEHVGATPDVPMYLILNTAVGGHWPGYPDDSTVFPQSLQIDRVRVFEFEATTP